jgi:hypothetical protein
MFFLFTNISIGKYYPNIVVQFVFGVVCYAISFFIMKDFISASTYEKYKYYMGIIVIVDTSFLVYQYKYNSINDSTIPSNVVKIPTEEFTTEINSKTTLQSELDVSFTSDFDYKVMHDLSLDDNDEKTALPISESDHKDNATMSFSMQT